MASELGLLHGGDRTAEGKNRRRAADERARGMVQVLDAAFLKTVGLWARSLRAWLEMGVCFSNAKKVPAELASCRGTSW